MPVSFGLCEVRSGATEFYATDPLEMGRWFRIMISDHLLSSLADCSKSGPDSHQRLP